MVKSWLNYDSFGFFEKFDRLERSEDMRYQAVSNKNLVEEKKVKWMDGGINKFC